jgi:hypothetical protein
MRPHLNDNRCLRFSQPFLDDAAKIIPGFQRDIPPYRVTMRLQLFSQAFSQVWLFAGVADENVSQDDMIRRV